MYLRAGDNLEPFAGPWLIADRAAVHDGQSRRFHEALALPLGNALPIGDALPGVALTRGVELDPVRGEALQRDAADADAEYDEQIEESKVHAAQFKRTLEIAAKRFAALANVEERHANHYKAALDKLNAAA